MKHINISILESIIDAKNNNSFAGEKFILTTKNVEKLSVSELGELIDRLEGIKFDTYDNVRISFNQYKLGYNNEIQISYNKILEVNKIEIKVF